MEDADAAMALDGMKFEGRPMEVRRPKEGEDMNARKKFSSLIYSHIKCCGRYYK